jgi:hypothetical protein
MIKTAHLSQIFGSDVNIEYRTAEYRTAEMKKYLEIRNSTFLWDKSFNFCLVLALMGLRPGLGCSALSALE